MKEYNITKRFFCSKIKEEVQIENRIYTYNKYPYVQNILACVSAFKCKGICEYKKDDIYIDWDYEILFLQERKYDFYFEKAKRILQKEINNINIEKSILFLTTSAYNNHVNSIFLLTCAYYMLKKIDFYIYKKRITVLIKEHDCYLARTIYPFLNEFKYPVNTTMDTETNPYKPNILGRAVNFCPEKYKSIVLEYINDEKCFQMIKYFLKSYLFRTISLNQTLYALDVKQERIECENFNKKYPDMTLLVKKIEKYNNSRENEIKLVKENKNTLKKCIDCEVNFGYGEECLCENCFKRKYIL